MDTHFGYETVSEGEKTRRVAGVFSSVAKKYDVMNDLMSLGMHRVWKAMAINASGVRRGHRVLDVASGSGDLARAFARRVGAMESMESSDAGAKEPSAAGARGEVWATDINGDMLGVGRDRLIDRGMVLPAVQCDAEALPLPANYFDCVSVAFGLRNMTHKDRALAEMRRVLRPGGRLVVLEFSRVPRLLERPYDWYSFRVLPWLGERVAGDGDSYRYLAESIRMHPGQEDLKAMMEQAGLEDVDYTNLSGGVVALHRGFKY